MPLEIEHKFLLADDTWRNLVDHSSVYRQGYLSSDEYSSIRVRVSNDTAWINIKSATIGTQRDEFEYAIPVKDANEILDKLCHKPLIEKCRYFVKIGPHTWEIDEFSGANQGLIVAEIELSSQDETFEKPSWIGEEVTHDVKYYNNNLVKHPFCEWPHT